MLASELTAAVVDKGLCIGCGVCTAVNAGKGKPIIRMEYSALHDHSIPVLSANSVDSDAEVVCPGAVMHMPDLANTVYGHMPEDQWIGKYKRIRASYASNPDVRARSASGGVTTAMLSYLFNVGAIDAVYCVASVGAPGTRAGVILRSEKDLSLIHGSVYHPAVQGANLSDLIAGKEKFAFVGLPCEIASLEMLKKNNHALAERHVLSIGLFCGGINRFRGVDYYLNGFGTKLKGAKEIDYRYGDWPGKIRMIDESGKTHNIPRIRGNTRWKILRYVVAFQGYWMLPRCRMCPDQISDFADVSVGDPHLPRFRHQGGKGYSAVVLRSERGVRWYDMAIDDGYVKDEDLGRDELIASQGYTLDNRRHALAYVRVAKWLGMDSPELSVYPEFERPRFRHYKYALVDLLKIRVNRITMLRPLYIPLQVFEYLFITLAPRVFVKRLVNLFFNK